MLVDADKGMDSVILSESESVRNGLAMMLDQALGPHEYVQMHVQPEIALLIIELAKRAPDRDEWFPRGKWATIQSIYARIEKELDKLCW